MKNLILMILMLISFLTFGQKIKTAVYWTSPRLYNGDSDNLAKFDLLIIDLENMINNRDSLVKIKKINPNVKLIAYSNPMEIFDPRMDWRPLQNAWSDEIYAKYPNWLLKTDRGKKAIFWKGMVMLNLSSACPKINGLTYSEWMANILLTRALSDSIWDGYFMDNSGGNISWVYSGKREQIDANVDGLPDIDTTLDKSWSEGIQIFLNIIREKKGKEFILLGNKGSVEFVDVLNGKMFEDWPNNYLGDKRDGGWHQCMINAAQTGPYTIFQVNSERNLEFAVASSLLLNEPIYIAINQNNSKYYDYFKYDLGKATTTTFKRYEKAIIEVNPSQREGKIFILQE
ncbi:TPA: hypothetical protein DCZ15_00810 [Candidatus Falkowbacteria bacterium]|nr:MAG: hypothetical protein UV95_C0003G0023 [Candidatus Falkowbacteria bacterium GW2011_GWF2_43_32]HBA36395.1 hypothetical protein [Candidatus Falkowbacteria bacterium]